jgi:hypothetical protein
MSLLFMNADDDAYVNIGIMIIIIGTLSKTSRNTLKLNNEKLHAFYFLVKNPVALNLFLNKTGKGNVRLSEIDSFSISSISPNLEPLFDRSLLKSLLAVLISKKLIDVTYKESKGFFYILTTKGINVFDELKEEHFIEIKLFCEKLTRVMSISDTEFNSALQSILKRDYL